PLPQHFWAARLWSAALQFLSISPGIGRRTRSPQRRQWPESTGPESSSKRRDYVPQRPTPSCRSNRPPEPRQAPPNQCVNFQSYSLSFLSPRPPRLSMFELLKNFLLVGGRRSFFLVLAHQQGEDRAQQHEDQRLHQAHQNFHEIKRNRQEPPEAGNHPGHGFQHGFAGIDVAIETKTQ